MPRDIDALEGGIGRKPSDERDGAKDTESVPDHSDEARLRSNHAAKLAVVDANRLQGTELLDIVADEQAEREPDDRDADHEAKHHGDRQ